MNAGFLEALKLDSDLDCFVFADVDLIPIHLCNIYECSQQPRHLAVNIDTFNYTYENEESIMHLLQNSPFLRMHV